MTHISRTVNFIIRQTPAFCFLSFAAVLLLLPISAWAQCANWDAGGEWKIKQKGSPYTNDLKLVQKGRVITGTALTLRDTKGGIFIPGGRDTVGGTVDGTIDGDSLSIQIFWSNNLTGVYKVKVLPSGRLDGEAWEKASPSIRQTWYSLGVLKCAAKGTTTNLFPQLQGNSPFSQSKSKSSKSAPTSKAFRGIVADQAIFPTQYERIGNVKLKWDVGADHPHVELWVKINRGPDLFVAKQGWNSSRHVMVERNHHYIYILRESGTVLAAVEFVAR